MRKYIQTPLGRIDIIRRRVAGCDAVFDPENMRICIDPELPKDRATSALLHEILHVCFSSFRTGIAKLQTEEQIVSYLEPLLFDILNRNKLLRNP